MKTFRIVFLLCLAACAWQRAIYAQNAAPVASPTVPAQENTAADAGPASSSQETLTPAIDPCATSVDNNIHGYPKECGYPVAPQTPTRSVASLDGSGMLSVGEHTRPLIVSGTALGGYETSFADTTDQGAAFSGGSGFAAITFAPSIGYVVLQNSLSVVSYRVGGGTTQYFDTFGLSAGGIQHGNLGWEAHIDNAYGNDALRLVAPIDTAAVANINVPAADTPAFSIQTNRVLDNNASFSARQLLSRSSFLRYTVQNSYRTIFGLDQNSNTLRGRVEYAVANSPNTNWGISNELARETGVIHCATDSVALNYQRQIRQRNVLQLSGGPAFGTSGCITTITGNFQGSLVSQVARFSTLYVSASRRLNDSIVLGATWEDTAQGGLIQQFGPFWQLRADAGYLRGTRPSAQGDFDSTFEGGSVSHEFGRGFSMQFSVRHLDYSNGDIAGPGSVAPNRSQIFGGITYSTNPRSARNEEVSIR